VGLILNLITGTNEELISGVEVSEKPIFKSYYSGQNSINFSYELSLGAHYKTSLALFDMSFFVNNSIAPDYVTGEYGIFNLENSPYTAGNFNIRNNFYGISLNVSPVKGWLR
jgi:hypothetical protein